MARWPAALTLHQVGTRPSRSRPGRTVYVIEFVEVAPQAQEHPVDAVEKFVADTLAKVLKISDPVAIATMETQVPAIVNGGMAVFALIGTIRAATKPAAGK